MARWQRDVAKERMWRRHVLRWQRSGRSIRDYCAAEGLAEANFHAWRRTLRQRDGESGRREDETALPAFLPVRVVNDGAASTAPGLLEIVCANGRVLRVGGDFDGQVVRRLLAILEEPAC